MAFPCQYSYFFTAGENSYRSHQCAPHSYSNIPTGASRRKFLQEPAGPSCPQLLQFVPYSAPRFAHGATICEKCTQLHNVQCTVHIVPTCVHIACTVKLCSVM